NSSQVIGSVDTISFKVNIVPNGSFGPFQNIAFVSALDSVNGVQVTDSSVTGLVPDSLPDSTQTTITLTPNPGIGISKAVTDTALLLNGSYDVTYKVIVRNYGNVTLDSIQVEDDLSLTFPAPVSFSVSNVTATGNLSANVSFNGS